MQQPGEPDRRQPRSAARRPWDISTRPAREQAAIGPSPEPLPIAGLFGNTANVDYYEFEWATAPGGAVEHDAASRRGGFSRVFWGPALPAGPGQLPRRGLSRPGVGGRLVIESREHFEATNDPGSWGLTRFWVANRDLLMQWLTATTFADGTYYLRLVGYALVAPDTLGPPQMLPLCDTEDDNGLVLTIDNLDQRHRSPRPTSWTCGSTASRPARARTSMRAAAACSRSTSSPTTSTVTSRSTA